VISLLVIINDSLKENSKKVRAIVGRYAWRVSRDVWIWPKQSLKYDILEELKAHQDGVRVLFIWPSKKMEFGYELIIHGQAKHRQTEYGLFNHLSEFSD
jgi:hypothetical protein